LTPLAAVAWAAREGVLNLTGTPLAFFGSIWAVVFFSVGALGELVGDKLPNTPSRKVPPAFAFRIVSGAFAGAAIGATAQALAFGAAAGAVGAIAGTLGGASVRGQLADKLKKDLYAALLEDAVAIIGAFAALGAR
jgi:uncharacterized membrane protein